MSGKVPREGAVLGVGGIVWVSVFISIAPNTLKESQMSLFPSQDGACRSGQRTEAPSDVEGLGTFCWLFRKTVLYLYF